MSATSRAWSASTAFYLLAIFIASATPAAAQSSSSKSSSNNPDVPRLKFFYFESTEVEWVVSAEQKSYIKHLAENEKSNRMVSTLEEAIHGPEQSTGARDQMTGWIADQRQSFERRSTPTSSYRRAEGIIAYLRAHDFSVKNLVSALRKRSGASEVQLIAIHQATGENSSQFKLKVVLDDAQIDIGQMGYNIDLSTPEITYVTAVYALGRALYEVHEQLAKESPVEELPEPELNEQVPDDQPDQPVSTVQPPLIRAALQ